MCAKESVMAADTPEPHWTLWLLTTHDFIPQRFFGLVYSPSDIFYLHNIIVKFSLWSVRTSTGKSLGK